MPYCGCSALGSFILNLKKKCKKKKKNEKKKKHEKEEKHHHILEKVFKSGLSRFCGRESLKDLLSPLWNTLSNLIIFSFAES